MKNRLLLALPLVLMALGLQTALAQQSPAGSKRVPQLTSEDLTSPPAASAAPVADAAPAAGSATGWSRHAFADLGVSIEFSGKPPASKNYQKQFAENNLFDSRVKAQTFRGNGWILIVTRLIALKKPSRDDLVNFAGGLVDRLKVETQEYLPEPGSEPNFRINGTRTDEQGEWGFSARFINQGKLVCFATIDCRQLHEGACAEARQVLASIQIIP